MNMYEKALKFATEKHKGQKRKYTGEDYITHPIAVAEKFENDFMKTIAVLHDVIEDTDATYTELEKEFGTSVMEYVYWLTDDVPKEKGNRKVRKIIYARKLRASPNIAQLVKIRDILHNVESVVEYDKDFAKVYIKENLELLGHLMWCKERSEAIEKLIHMQDRLNNG